MSCIEGLSKELQLIDSSACIDCGACGIVCPVSCITDPKGGKYPFLKPKERPKAVVSQLDCSGCSYCVDVCPFNCLELQDSPGDPFNPVAFNARSTQCVACKECVKICPRETITIEYPVETGGKKSA